MIVADSSPLIGLQRIDQLELLPRLFERVLVSPLLDALIRDGFYLGPRIVRDALLRTGEA